MMMMDADGGRESDADDPRSRPDRSRYGLNPMRRPNPMGVILRNIGQAPRFAARWLIWAYRYTFSALVGFHCRHLPTCSSYADEAIGRFGLWAGGWMVLARLCRCHPWGTAGLDFVPVSLAADQRWYLPWRYGRWRGTNPCPAADGGADAGSLRV
jgi:putative membrane protein insertion efficiency factor